MVRAQRMVILAGLLVVWTLAALAVVLLCAAARRRAGTPAVPRPVEVRRPRPAVLRTVGGHAWRQTRLG